MPVFSSSLFFFFFCKPQKL